MTDQVLWFQVQMDSYSSNWNTPYQNLIVTAGELQKCNLDAKKYHRNVWNASDCFSTILHESSINVLRGIRDSRRAGSLWGMMRGVGGVRKSIHQSWLAKGLGWGFKGVHEEIPSEEANTLQIGSVAVPPGQYTSPQLYPCHRLFEQDGHQYSSSSSLLFRPCSLWLLLIS